MNPAPFDLRTIERALYTQLAAVSLIGVGICGMGMGPGAAMAAAIGFAAAFLYYMMLSVQVRRQLAFGRKPNFVAVLVSLFSRQVVCLAAPTLSFFFIGQGWWVSLITLIIARHWVMVAGWPRRQAAASHVTA